MPRPKVRNLLALTLLMATACSADPTTATAPAALPTVAVTIGSKNFTLEVAADFAAREQGLMNRTKMDNDRGMIFIFAHSGIYKFWMKDTKIPLDLLFLAASGKVLHIVTLQPEDLTGFENYKPALYVVELNAGVAKSLNLNAGDTITLPAKLPAAR